MGKLGAKTMKRSLIWSNSPAAARFHTGVFRRDKKKGHSSLVRHYLDSRGQKRFQGSERLTQSGMLS